MLVCLGNSFSKLSWHMVGSGGDLLEKWAARWKSLTQKWAYMRFTVGWTGTNFKPLDRTQRWFSGRFKCLGVVTTRLESELGLKLEVSVAAAVQVCGIALHRNCSILCCFVLFIAECSPLFASWTVLMNFEVW